MSEYQVILDRDKMVMAEFREHVRNDYPLRVRVAAKLGGAIISASWAIGRHLPYNRATRRLWGDGGWDEGGIARWVGRTVCRYLGHWWEICGAPGSPSRNVGHMLFCATCTVFGNTDDLDAFRPGSRERRDLAALGCEIDALCWTARYCLPWPPRKAASLPTKGTP